MWENGITILYLAGLSIWDLRERKVPVWLLALGGIWALAAVIASWTGGMGAILEWGIALVPGGALLLLALATQKAGLADGIVAVQMGLLLGYREALFVFTVSLLAMSVFSMILLAVYKVQKTTKIPYIPFLCAAYCVCWIWGGK